MANYYHTSLQHREEEEEEEVGWRGSLLDAAVGRNGKKNRRGVWARGN